MIDLSLSILGEGASTESVEFLSILLSSFCIILIGRALIKLFHI